MNFTHHSLQPQTLICSREYRYTYVNLEWFVNNQDTGWVGNLRNLHSRLAQPKDEQHMKLSGNLGDSKAGEWVHGQGSWSQMRSCRGSHDMNRKVKGCRVGYLVRSWWALISSSRVWASSIAGDTAHCLKLLQSDLPCHSSLHAHHQCPERLSLCRHLFYSP